MKTTVSSPPFIPNFESLGLKEAQRFQKQIQFILEIDQAKNILRESLITDASRRENDAEHSWHIAMMALVLAEYAPEPIDICRVMKMLLIHDIVEIDAGDTYLYNEEALSLKDKQEQAAAQRLFGILPDDQAETFHTLWEEFEAKSSADARFAHMIDRLQPPLMNYASGGGTWKRYKTSFEQLTKRISRFKKGLPALSQAIELLIKDAYKRGWIR